MLATDHAGPNVPLSIEQGWRYEPERSQTGSYWPHFRYRLHHKPPSIKDHLWPCLYAPCRQPRPTPSSA